MRFTHTMTSAGSGRGTPASRPPLPVLPPRWQPRISQAVGAYRKEVGRGQRHPPVSLQAKRGDLDAKRGGRHTFSPPTAAFPPNSPPQHPFPFPPTYLSPTCCPTPSHTHTCQCPLSKSSCGILTSLTKAYRAPLRMSLTMRCADCRQARCSSSRPRRSARSGNSICAAHSKTR